MWETQTVNDTFCFNILQIVSMVVLSYGNLRQLTVKPKNSWRGNLCQSMMKFNMYGNLQQLTVKPKYGRRSSLGLSMVGFNMCGNL
jgi:hypothetical protein